MPQLDFDYLKAKAKREIARLERAEHGLSEDEAKDAALNAAFTVFHLLEWKEKQDNPLGKAKASALVDNCGNDKLKLLHDIVTHTKHVTVSVPRSTEKSPDVHVSASITQKSYSSPPIVRDNFTQHEVSVEVTSFISVKFNSIRAVDVLKGALDYFS